MLQWGHDFSAVEILVSDGKILYRTQSFNGATTFQPWKSVDHFQVSIAFAGLQWGHDFSAVEIQMDGFSASYRGNLLQWGHDFSAVEISW